MSYYNTPKVEKPQPYYTGVLTITKVQPGGGEGAKIVERETSENMKLVFSDKTLQALATKFRSHLKLVLILDPDDKEETD